jgi:hypothetical protein
LDIGSASSHQIVVYAQSTHFSIGSGLSGSNSTGIYSFSSGLISTTSNSLHISIANKSGAFNILNQLERGKTWFQNLGYTFTNSTGVLWPSSLGSYFEPTAGVMHILGVGADIDEFDDDIILHEFGHLAMEKFSLDHSLGGGHSLSGRYDLRLAWSEGAATFISSAIRNDSLNIDFTGGSTPSQVNINSPSSLQTQSSNEVAVAHVLWNAYLLDGSSGQRTIDAMAKFKSLPSTLSDEQISLDTFMDVYAGSNISSYTSERQMAYQHDQLSLGKSSTAPEPVTESKTSSGLTFYPSKGSDWFSFSGNAGDNLIITTLDTGNGALTFLKFYDEKLALLASNEQASTAISETTSKLDLTITTTGNYLIEAGRFTSTTKNVGYNASINALASAYSKTVGRYGNYSLKFEITRSTASPSNSGSSTTSTGNTTTDTTTSTGNTTTGTTTSTGNTTTDTTTSTGNTTTDTTTSTGNTTTGSTASTGNTTTTDSTASTGSTTTADSTTSTTDTTAAVTTKVEANLNSTINSTDFSTPSNISSTLASIANNLGEGVSAVSSTVGEVSYAAQIVSSASEVVTIKDSTLDLNMSNLPLNTKFYAMTSPLSNVQNILPTGATGKLMTFQLQSANNTTISTGFNIQMTLKNTNASSSSKLYVYQSSSNSFVDSGFDLSTSGSDLIITVTHFSSYILVDNPSSTATTNSAAALTSGGGGGGCLIR